MKDLISVLLMAGACVSFIGAGLMLVALYFLGGFQ